MEEKQKQMIDDLGIDYFMNQGELPSWLMDIVERLIDKGWAKDKK